MKPFHLALFLCALLFGCQHRSARAEHKPTAPVKLALQTRALGPGEYELTLSATTTAALDALELEVGETTERFSGLGDGDTRTISARVHLRDDDGREVIGTARTVKGARQMTAATGQWLGVKPPEQPTTLIRLPDGDQAAEVRE